MKKKTCCKLDKFLKDYKIYWKKVLKKYGDTWVADGYKMDDLLYDIKRSICNLEQGSSSGCMRTTVKINVELEYGNIGFFDDPSDIKGKINIPIRIIEGSRGNKHLAIKVGKDRAIDLGKCEFKNRINRSGWVKEVEDIENIIKKKLKEKVIIEEIESSSKKSSTNGGGK